jgi:hypothetical protein
LDELYAYLMPAGLVTCPAWYCGISASQGGAEIPEIGNFLAIFGKNVVFVMAASP